LINIKLTSRDMKILFDLYKSSFLAFYQIKDVHFKTQADSTVYNRLSKLIRADVIKSIRVNLLGIHKDNLEIGVIYSITKKGLTLLKAQSYFSIERFNPIQINLNQLTHDLVLTDALRVLNGTNSKLLNLKSHFDEQIPDGVIQKENKKIALEVELTAKSNQRYRDILTNYMTSMNYDEVIYLVKDETVSKKICHHLAGYSDHSKFTFVTLRDFFSDTNFNNRRHFNEL
jgi:hypothetical protein